MFSELFPIDWSAFHFLRPQFLWLLIPALLIPVLGAISIRQEVHWKSIIAPHLRQYVIRKGNDRVKTWMNIALFVSLGFGVLALSGPAWKKVELPGQELETPMVILLDLSQSMMATDLQPNRLERAKFKITDLLKKDPKARAALIGFSGTAHTIVPLTKDYDIILSSIDGLKPAIMPYPGSNLQAALTLADTVMSKTKAPGTVVILSDDFESSHLNMLQNFTAGTEHAVIVLPINTKQGSPVPDIGGKGTMKDRNGHEVFSSLDEEVLSELSSLENVKVQPLTLDDSDVALISDHISKNLVFKTKPEEKKDDWQDAGLLFIIPVGLMMLLWFRRGWVVYTIPLFLLTSCSDVSDFAGLWYTKDYQGQRMLNKGNYSDAAEHFTDPMHKGVAYFKAGEFENAIDAFKQDTTAQGSYNLGLAYYNNGDTAAALLAFGLAVAKDPEMEPARAAQEQLSRLKSTNSGVDPEKAKEAQPEQTANNEENKDMEDLSGGGQEATKKDMEKERKEETVGTDIRKGKELNEVPDDIGAGAQKQDNSKVLMRKVDDDPALFFKRKFEYQVKKEKTKPESDGKKW